MPETVAESRERALRYVTDGQVPPRGERGDTLLAIAHLRAEQGWTNHQMYRELQALGRAWGKYSEGNLYGEALVILSMIRNVRKKIRHE